MTKTYRYDVPRWEAVGLDWIVQARREEMARRQRVERKARWTERAIVLAMGIAWAAAVYLAASHAL